MKKTGIFLAAAFVLPLMRYTDVCAVEVIETSAKAAIVISADTGEVICSHNSDQKLPMASTTKIMSALLCIESGNLDEEFVVDSDAIHVEGSSMGLQEGDIVTKYALCCGMLLPSGNDAANAAAVRIAGSQEKFADLMNTKAQKLGLSRTFFVTPSGLEGEGHGSSARDMAILASVALRDPTFREICSSETICLEYGNPPYKRWLKNTNKLLSLYSGTYGVKTGFTDEAGRCLVSACSRDEKELICVTLNDRNDWNDHMNMYDSCFKRAKVIEPELPEDITLNVVGGTADTVAVNVGEPVKVTAVSAEPEDFEYAVLTSPFIYAPIQQGDELAELSVRYDGREIRRIPLYSEENVEYMKADPKKKKSLIDKIKGVFS